MVVITLKLKKNTIIKDYNNNFKLSIPTYWKTELYFNKNLSEISVADTTKQLTQSFILTTSYNYGSLKFNERFYIKSDSILAYLNLKKVKYGDVTFQSKPAYWYLAKGFKNGFPFHQFNVIVLNSENSYLNAVAEIYGDDTIDERICEAISILNTIKYF